MIAALEDADPQRAAFLAPWHDSQETRTTDLPHLTKKYVAAADSPAVTADQVRFLPRSVAEYEAGDTAEAKCARDADKLECLLQAREYQDQGHSNVQAWIDTSIASRSTATAKQIAHEAIAQNTLAWLDRARQT
jgi:putative hydrolases of HD superfamily